MAENEDIKTENTEQEQTAKPEKTKKPRKNPFRNRKLKYGSISVVITIICIALVVLINVVLNLVLDRFNVEADLTTNQLFTLGEETEKYVRELDSEIMLYVTAEKDTLRNSDETLYEQVVEFLDKMEALNPKLTVKYVNLLTDPDFSKDYVETLSNYQIIVKSGKTSRYRILTMSDFMKFVLSDGNTYSYSEASMYVNYGGYTVTDYYSNTEEQLVSAMMNVSKENPTTVAFLTGYNESDTSTLESILTDNAYVIEKIEIDKVQQIPEETDVAVICGPRDDYSLDAITKVDEWLSNGGNYGKNLVYLATPDAADTPNLDEYLAEWGLSVEKGYIIQEDASHAYYTGMTIALMQDLDIKTDTIYADNMKTADGASFVGYYVRPVTKLYDEDGNIKNTVIASAYGDQCRIFPFSADENWDLSQEELKAYDVMVESAKVRFDGATPVYSKVIACGSDLLFNKNFTSASNYSNGEMALALFDANSDNSDTEIKIVQKSFKSETYQLSKEVQITIGIVFAVVIPLVMIIIGIIVWAKRRRL
ncbi:MAG: GldG family protein [Ruminiclostridium sp.]|nr:GldG family protein [Ruminiclostridium sp.]